MIPCNLGESLCVYDQYGNMYFERFDIFFIQVFTSWILVLLVFIAIFAVAFTDSCGIVITKNYGGLTKCLIATSKTAGVWIIGLIVTFSVEDNSDYQL
jgi:hypothetical protein